jgi:hypothetical protein
VKPELDLGENEIILDQQQDICVLDQLETQYKTPPVHPCRNRGHELLPKQEEDCIFLGLDDLDKLVLPAESKCPLSKNELQPQEETEVDINLAKQPSLHVLDKLVFKYELRSVHPC